MTLLKTRMVAKPWGRTILPPPFGAVGEPPVGEVWFEPPAALPDLLAKYIFSSQNLSVQVHPSAAQTRAMGLGDHGKEECWLVIDAEPGARLALGFRDGLSPDSGAVRQAALDGTLEELLQWHAVAPGDVVYIPANTVHATGAGVSLLEISENSDITYRLYDYGRDRPLHLDAGLGVARLESGTALAPRRLAASGEQLLVDGPAFRADRLDGPPSPAVAAAYDGPLLVLPLDGTVTVGDQPVAAGGGALALGIDAVSVPAGTRAVIARPR